MPYRHHYGDDVLPEIFFTSGIYLIHAGAMITDSCIKEKKMETTPRIFKAGIDIGSVTAKMVLLDDLNTVIFSRYLRHNTRIDKFLQKILNDLLSLHGNIYLDVAITGTAGMGVSEFSGIPFIQEVVASADAVRKLYPETKVLIDIGGEDSKLIFFNEQMNADIRMNGNCAGGTGSFIDQMATLLNVSLEKIDETAVGHDSIYPIASRCGVFAKTDVQYLLSNHVPAADIAASTFHAVAIQTINTLAQGHDIQPKVLFCGGPLHFFKGLRDALTIVMGITSDDVILPDQPQLIPSIGAAVADGKDKLQINIKDLIRMLDSSKRINLQAKNSLEPLFKDRNEFKAWETRKSKDTVQHIDIKTLDNNDSFLGIDAGSTTTKIVVMDGHGNVAYKFYSGNMGNPVETVQKGLKQLQVILGKNNTSLNIRRTAVTGYGEDLIRAAYSIDDGIVETLAHYNAAKAFAPNVSFVLDIGGQDMKAFFVKDGIINRIEINEACSSGCGTFIETFANSLNHSVADFARMACDARQPYDLGTRCTVFMNSKIKQALREGATTEDISAGLAFSVIRNCFNKVLKIHDTSILGQHIVVQGGTFRNQAVLRAMEKYLAREVVRPSISELMGAYGAALIAKENWKKEKPQSNFIGLERLDDIGMKKTRAFGCKGCENQCPITEIIFGNDEKYITGNRCENIYSNGKDNISKGRNFLKIEYDLIFNRKTTPDKKPIAVIGIPRVLNMFENFPFWCTLFVECGIQVLLSRPSTSKIAEKGSGTIMSDNICFPAKLANGHIADLIKMGVEHIFYPMVKYEKNELKGSTNSYNCPVVTGYPEVIRSSINPHKQGVAFDFPPVVFNDDILLKKACFEYLSKKFRISKKTFTKAFKKALDTGDELKTRIRELGNDIIRKAEAEDRLLVVLAGRPYHLDPLINSNIPRIISRFGVDVLSVNAIPVLEKEVKKDATVLTQWEYPTRLYNAAKWVGKTQNTQLIQLNSFGCGPDAVTIDEVRAILEQYGKSSTLLRIDEITGTGSVKLRVRSMIESQKLNATPIETEIFAPRKTTPFYKKSDIRKTVIVPDFPSFYNELLTPLFSRMGYNFEVLPESDQESAELGLKYSNNDICYPCTICIGDILKALKSGRYDVNNTVACISETGGQCRASNYANLLRKALINSGFDNVPVITIAPGKIPLNYQPGFEIDYLSLIFFTFSIFLFIDQLLKMYYATRVREKRKGAALSIVKKYLDMAKNASGKYGIQNSMGLLKAAVEEFNAVDAEEKSYPRVGIVGEIYMKYSPFGNNDIANWLMEQGVEVVIPPITSFFIERFVDIHTNHILNITRAKSSERAIYSFLEKYINSRIRKSNHILNNFRHPVIPVHTIGDISLKAEKIVSLIHQYGEGWLLPGEVAILAESGINNVVSIQPFGCIANHIVARGVGKRIKDLYPKLNFLCLDMDAGDSKVNIFNRLHILVKHAAA